MDYYLLTRDGQQAGPYSLDQMRQMWGTGKITLDTPCWTQEMSAWQPLRNLESAIRSTPPVSNQIPPVPSTVPPPGVGQPKPQKSGFQRKAVRRLVPVALLLLAVAVLVSIFGLGKNASKESAVPKVTPPVASTQAEGVPASEATGGGVIAPVASTQAEVISNAESHAELEQAQYEVLKDRACRASGTVIQRLDDGYLIEASLISNFEQHSSERDWFVACDHPTLVDGDHFDEVVYWTGEVFTYTNALGAQRTVRKLTLSKESLISKLKAEIAKRQGYLAESYRYDQAKRAEAARQAAQEKANLAVKEESDFIDNLKKAVDAISASKLDDAQQSFNAASQLKPTDPRLNDVKTRLEKAQFGLASKSFQDAIERGDIADAYAKLSAAKVLLPDDPSIASLRTQFLQLGDRMFQGIDTKLTAGDMTGVDKDYSDLAAFLPDDSRRGTYKTKILRTKFDSSIKAFSQALQSQDTQTASAKLSEAESLIPDDASLGGLHTELLEAKFAKSSARLGVLLFSSNFGAAKSELQTLRDLKIEPDKTAALSAQLSDAIKKAIISDVDRCKEALRSNNVAGATQALENAKTLNVSDATAIALEQQISDFKYAAGMTSALKKVRAGSLPDASSAIDQVLTDRPGDAIATQTKKLLTEYMPIAQAKIFKPEEAIASRAIPGDNILYTAHITGWDRVSANEVPNCVYCAGQSAPNGGELDATTPYRLKIYAPGMYTKIPNDGEDDLSWRVINSGVQYAKGNAPAVGTTVLVYGPVGGEIVPRPTYFNKSSFTIRSIRVLPNDYILQQKKAILETINKALAKSTSSAIDPNP